VSYVVVKESSYSDSEENRITIDLLKENARGRVTGKPSGFGKTKIVYVINIS